MTWWEWLLAVLGVLIFVAAIGSFIDSSAKCDRKGGVYFCARGSTCVCLAPGVVLP